MAFAYSGAVALVDPGVLRFPQVMSPANKLRMDCGNCAAWATRMKFLLCQEQVWYVIEGKTAAAVSATGTVGVDTATGAGGVVDPDKDEKACGLTGASVGAAHLHVVADAPSATAAWDELEVVAKAAVPLYARELRKKLATFRDHADKPVYNVLAEIILLRREMQAAGIEAAKDEYCTARFEALPTQFAPIEQAWEAGSGVATLKELQPMLLAVERGLKRDDEAFALKAHAFLAPRRSTGRVQFNGACWTCGKQGDTRRKLTRGHRSASQGRTSRSLEAETMFVLCAQGRTWANVARTDKKDDLILDSWVSSHINVFRQPREFQSWLEPKVNRGGMLDKGLETQEQAQGQREVREEGEGKKNGKTD
ncbi:hypothetical protein FVE85_4996 [Porphyridium purpureum]|uniref:Uncharacterized protein n=1 Tax=Porphyridium purpureum TaxID=35688 RepID=A0A5J4YQX0_PORPP|nr:hypothetical protein FVE85_4996 [Porphyridium purpureum]|eukprot:POR3221..scf236_6